MPTLNNRMIRLFVEIGFRDPARPVEWVSIIALTGWAQFLLQSPDIFRLPRYEAFAALPPIIWAGIILGVIVTQLFSMRPRWGRSPMRFVAMALATGIWVVIAFNFWEANTAPLSARTTGAIAFVAAMTGVYLGWTSQRS